MEAVWTRFFPAASEIRDVVARGGLGVVKRVWADLSFWNDVEAQFGRGHRMVNMDLAGGVLLDCESSSSSSFSFSSPPSPAFLRFLIRDGVCWGAMDDRGNIY